MNELPLEALRAPWRRSPRSPALPPPEQHRRALRRALGRPLVEGNAVDLLLDGPQTHAAMFEAIAGARHQVHIESYIIDAEGPGQDLAARLIELRARGVEVCVLYDALGSLGTSEAYFEALRRHGVQVCAYRPLSRLSTLFSRAVHLRDHRKLLIVDAEVAFIGGVNISTVYGGSKQGADGGDAGGWRDTHLRVRGPVVSELQAAFIAHWQRHACQPLVISDPEAGPAAVGDQAAALAICDAGRRRNPFYRALLAAIASARHSVLLTAAYFVPTQRLLHALQAAARRGVEVRLLLPAHSDSWAPLHAGRYSYGLLLRAGVHLHELQGPMLHAKTCVIDGVWCTVGSSNYDWRSFLHNAEANLVLVDERLGAELQRVFAADLASSVEIDRAQWKQRGWWQRLKERIAQRFEFLL